MLNFFKKLANNSEEQEKQDFFANLHVTASLLVEKGLNEVNTSVKEVTSKNALVAIVATNWTSLELEVQALESIDKFYPHLANETGFLTIINIDHGYVQSTVFDQTKYSLAIDVGHGIINSPQIIDWIKDQQIQLPAAKELKELRENGFFNQGDN